jgi:hypothetical protein
MIIDTNLLIFALIGIIAILTILVIRLEFRIKKLVSGKSGKSLEGSIYDINDGIARLDSLHDEMRKQMEGVEKRVRRGIKRAETVRFNPFKGTSGGNQSFATALLDEEGSGVVISSLYSRDRVSVFAKPINSYSSEYELSQEEKQAIKKVREI